MSSLHLFWALNIMPLFSSDGKEQAKSTIRDYILALYAVMEKEGTCFLRGSFVIDDLNGRFKQLLATAKTNPRFKIPESHTGFNPVRTTICKDGVCEVHTEVMIKCGEDGIKKENIKWYVFNNTGDGPVDRYVFLKLEGEATISFAHAFRAFERYGLKKQAKTGVSTPTRRQDCQKDKKGCHCPRQGCKQDKQTVKIGDICLPKRQQYGRIGDEYFVTSDLNDALIDRVTTIKGSVQTIINDIGPCQQARPQQVRTQQVRTQAQQAQQVRTQQVRSQAQQVSTQQPRPQSQQVRTQQVRSQAQQVRTQQPRPQSQQVRTQQVRPQAQQAQQPRPQSQRAQKTQQVLPQAQKTQQVRPQTPRTPQVLPQAQKTPQVLPQAQKTPQVLPQAQQVRQAQVRQAQRTQQVRPQAQQSKM